MVVYGREKNEFAHPIAYGVHVHPIPVSRVWELRAGRADAERGHALCELQGGTVTRPTDGVSEVRSEDGREELPEFDLDCLYDDPATPTELTIFSPGTERRATEWVTVDQSVALPLDEIR